MTTLKIVTYPHPSLTTPAKPVIEFDAALGTFLDDMAETMYANQGVGLAANQVDVLKRVIVIDVGDDDNSQLIELINPEITEADGEIVWEEGCLSFPDLTEKVTRAGHVKVRYQDRHGEAHEIEGEKLFGVALQHEIDHLNGVVFVDKMGKLTRRLALKRFRKTMSKSGDA